MSFLLQLAFILIACRIAGMLARRLGQPAVVGEMAAGIFLAPVLFPVDAGPALGLLGKAGLILYMVGTGLEFETSDLRARWRGTASVSLAGIAAPFALGAALAGPLGVSPIFLGAAMSITAFPVLARILEETGRLQSRVGRTALAAGSFDDAAAALLLAFGLALPAQSPIFIASGAFLAGILLRPVPGARAAGRAAAPFTAALLLPIYFAFTGLNADMSLLLVPANALIAVVVLIAAVAGKAGACYLAARWSGESRWEAAALGALMNARGMMELVILNAGLEHGFIQPPLFTALVAMALATTLMATPMFNWTWKNKETDSTWKTKPQSKQPSEPSSVS